VLRGVNDFAPHEILVDVVVLNTVDDGASHAVSRARERSRRSFHRARARSTSFDAGSRDSEWCDFAKFSTIYFPPERPVGWLVLNLHSNSRHCESLRTIDETMRRRSSRPQRHVRCTKPFWALLLERVRSRLTHLHGDENAFGGGWTRQATSYDVRRATILARRDVLANESVHFPPNFERDFFTDATELTLRRVRVELTRDGFNARVAGQLASSRVATRLATMPTLDWNRVRDVGKQTLRRAFRAYFVKLYILDVGTGTKSWTRWLIECVPQFFSSFFVIVTIDWDPARNPDILGDVTLWRDWLRRELVRLGYGNIRWHIVHFAAECVEFSPQKNSADEERDLTYATWLAQCGMQLIIELRPLIWLIECSGAGAHALKTQPIMQGRMRDCLVDLTLCSVAMTLFRKESSWWTNIPRAIYSHYGFPDRPCSHAEGRKCMWRLVFGRHPAQVGGGHGRDDPTVSVKRDESMQYPPILCAQWIASAVHAMLHYEEAREEDFEQWLSQ